MALFYHFYSMEMINKMKDAKTAIMTVRTRKFVLTLHILFSVGWLGAVLTYLALVITGLVSGDHRMISVIYPALALVGWYVIVPYALAAMLTC
jgi:hypothetical protein